ncbi:MAG: DUF488 family protein [Acidimicrobiaceae bacterium]|nr:DUF488 family protein [Acidimicrobiaceae bacterium]
MVSPSVAIARVYEDPNRLARDYRVVVDRLWPRGMTKDAVDYDQWAKDIGPSTKLRKWYGHDVGRFEEFSRQYIVELDTPAQRSLIDGLIRSAGSGRLILLTATRDIEHSAAKVLKSVIEGNWLARNPVTESDCKIQGKHL